MKQLMVIDFYGVMLMSIVLFLVLLIITDKVFL